MSSRRTPTHTGTFTPVGQTEGRAGRLRASSPPPDYIERAPVGRRVPVPPPLRSTNVRNLVERSNNIDEVRQGLTRNFGEPIERGDHWEYRTATISGAILTLYLYAAIGEEIYLSTLPDINSVYIITYPGSPTPYIVRGGTIMNQREIDNVNRCITILTKMRDAIMEEYPSGFLMVPIGGYTIRVGSNQFAEAVQESAQETDALLDSIATE